MIVGLMSEPTEPRVVTGTVPFQIDTTWLFRRSTAVTAEAHPLVIALHGQGMTAELMMRLLPLPAETGAHYLLPQGPYPSEKRKEGSIRIGYGWYSYDGNQANFRRELERAEAHVIRVIERISETARIDPARTVLVGFSQGGYLAGFTALRHPELFAGLVLIATRLKHEFLEDELDRGTPPRTLLVHSSNDPAMSLERARESAAHIERAGGQVVELVHDGGHTIPRSLGTELAAWMERNGFQAASG